MNLKHLFIILFFLTAIAVEGQVSVLGSVKDKTNKGIEFVTVKLQKDTTIVAATITDSTGNFFFSIPLGEYRISLTLVSYATISESIVFTKDTAIAYGLLPDGKTMQVVNVLSKKPLIERKLGKLIFNVERSMAALSGDAVDVLSMTPGLNVQQDNISIVGRGGVGVMLNDKMIPLAGTDLINYIRAIPSNTIEKIEIISNPGAIYSAENNGGLINIKTKKIKIDYWTTTLRSVMSQTTYLTGQESVNFDFKKNKLTFSSGVNYSNGSIEATERPYIYYPMQTWRSDITRRDYTEYYNGRILADYDVSKRVNIGTQIFFSKGMPYTNDENKTNIRLHNILGPLYEYDSILIAKGNSSAEWTDFSCNINATFRAKKEGGKVVVDFDYYNRKYISSRIVNSHSYNEKLDTLPGLHFLATNTGNRGFVNYSLNISAVKKIKAYTIQYGTRLLSTESNTQLTAENIFNYNTSLFRNDDKYRFIERTGALFATVDKMITDKLEIEVGLRAENTTTRGTSFSQNRIDRNEYLQLFPSAYLLWNINEKHGFSFSYGRRIERPQYGSLNPFQRYIAQNYYSVGNPYLLPSFINNVELVYGYKDFLEFTAFTSISNNESGQVSYANANTKLLVDTMQNSYGTSTYGLKMLYILKGIKWLESNTEINGFYLDINQKVAVLPQANRGWVGYLSTTNTIKINNAFSLMANYWYYTNRYKGIFKQTQKSNVTLGLRWRFYNNKVNINFLVNDLFKKSQSDLSATVDGIRQFYDNYYDNRFFRVTLQYKFGNMKIQTKQRRGGNEDEKERAK